jgi:hypothetical protein
MFLSSGISLAIFVDVFVLLLFPIGEVLGSILY